MNKEALGLDHSTLHDDAAGANQRVARTHQYRGVSVDWSRAVCQFAGEAVAQAIELLKLRIAQVKIRELTPQRDTGSAQPPIFNAAQPPREQREPTPRNPVGQQEIHVLLLDDSVDQRAPSHPNVIQLK